LYQTVDPTAYLILGHPIHAAGNRIDVQDAILFCTRVDCWQTGLRRPRRRVWLL